MTDLHRLDADHIAEAAEYAAVTLSSTGVASVELTPGDHTRYPVTLVSPHPTFTRAGTTLPREVLVVLRHGNGRAYPWQPHIHIDPGYATEKWGDGNGPTGEVMAAFLNAVRERLGWE